MSNGDVYVDVEQGHPHGRAAHHGASPHWRAPLQRQQAVDAFMDSLEGAEGPTYYSYPTFVRYLTVAGSAFSYGEPLGGDIAETMAAVAKRLLALAGGAVYLADERAYVRETLRDEFPELTIFRIRLDEAFAESSVCPGLWIETRRFAELRCLSRMRRELKKTGIANGFKAVDVVKALLGLEAAHH